MRRAISVLMIVFFGLGPLAVTLSASDESRLPACCRRHGAHRCTMSQQMAATMSPAEPGTSTVKAPTTCPYFPGYTVAPNTITLALAPAPLGLPSLLAQLHNPAAGRAAARISQLRTRATRGPPALPLA